MIFRKRVSFEVTKNGHIIREALNSIPIYFPDPKCALGNQYLVIWVHSTLGNEAHVLLNIGLSEHLGECEERRL